MALKKTEQLLMQLVNLTSHPLFHEQTELPVWDQLINDAKEALWEATDGPSVQGEQDV